jgi:hypothetical protein
LFFFTIRRRRWRYGVDPPRAGSRPDGQGVWGRSASSGLATGRTGSHRRVPAGPDARPRFTGPPPMDKVRPESQSERSAKIHRTAAPPPPISSVQKGKRRRPRRRPAPATRISPRAVRRPHAHGSRARSPGLKCTQPEMPERTHATDMPYARCREPARADATP